MTKEEELEYKSKEYKKKCTDNFIDNTPIDIFIKQIYKDGYNACLDDMRKQTIVWTYSEEKSKDINSLGLYLMFLDETRSKIGVHYDFAYSKTLDWYLRIWRKGVNDDGSDVEIFQDQTCDILDLLSRGCTVLKQYIEEVINEYWCIYDDEYSVAKSY